MEAGKRLEGEWLTTGDDGRYDLWVLGPNGFHRHCAGRIAAGAMPPLAVTAAYAGPGASLRLSVHNPGPQPRTFRIEANAYDYPPQTHAALAPGEAVELSWDMTRTDGWYDVTVQVPDDPAWTRRLAGRIETGAPSTSDPAMGQALMLQWTPLP